MHTLRTLIAAVMLVAVCGGARATDTQRRSIGSDIGAQTTVVMCPQGSLLVGFLDVLGYWLYMIYPVCAPANGDGHWSSATIDRSHPLQNPGGLGAHNIEDFLAPTAACKPDAYVIGLEATVIPVVEGRQTYVLPGAMRPVCRTRSDATPWTFTSWRDWRRPTQELPWATPGAALDVPWDGPTGARSCRAGEAAVGLWGSTDAWLRSVGLVCRTWVAVRAVAVTARGPVPRPTERISERGAAGPTPVQQLPTRNAGVKGTLVHDAPDGSAQLCERYPPLCDKARWPPVIQPRR